MCGERALERPRDGTNPAHQTGAMADAATPRPRPRLVQMRPKAWTAGRLRGFLDLAAGALPTTWILLAASAAGRGECSVCRWCEVDLDEGTAIICRQVTALDHHVVVKELPKTKQAHLVRLDSATVSMLRQVHAHQAEAKLSAPARATRTMATCSATSTARPHHLSEPSTTAARMSRGDLHATAPPMQSDAADRVAKLIHGSSVTPEQPPEP